MTLIIDSTRLPVLAKTDAASPASECRDLPKKYGTDQG
jgi:hypothetical protein